MALDGRELHLLRMEMAAAHPSCTFSHLKFTDGQLIPPASVAADWDVFNEYRDQSDDYLRTGM